MLAQHHTTLADVTRPSCLWRCKCGLALIARRIDGRAELHYRGKKRVNCPHCKQPLADQVEARRAA